jgi:heme/copper-type cytochrome/quinol oxidase subunit 3
MSAATSHAAATSHGAVEPAESPLTPESWGKLGMWIFLAGDAVGFGTLLGRLRRHARDQRGLARIPTRSSASTSPRP